MSKNKDKELCRFYARGQCTRGKECRFDHPSICKKFRQFGSISTNKKGCDGKCINFHPNACRNSVKNRTCDWRECKFFHLKGTKRIIKDTGGSQSQYHNRAGQHYPNQNRNGNLNQNGRGENWNRNGFQNRNQNQNVNLSHNRNSNNNDNYNSINSNNNDTYHGRSSSDNGQVFQQDQPELALTLQEIMRRLSAMETRQAMIPIPTQPTTPNLSPAVPQLSTQTQNQWASQGNQWTQSQY